MKIVLSGGGTLGPVVPLLAVYETYKEKYPNTEFIWVGTRKGPEREMIEKRGIKYKAIFTAKWRRYFSLKNIHDLIKFVFIFFHSFYFLVKEKPDILISAGGFVSVPLHFAGSVLGIPSWVHQQDVRPGLANRLMSYTATKVTVAINESLQYFPIVKSEWIGNPARDLEFENKELAKMKLGIKDNEPVIFALGGGTGSFKVNKMILEALNHWPKSWHVIHLVGKERPTEMAEKAVQFFPNYQMFRFFDEEMKYAYAASDVVVSRAGFGTITELALLSKAAILLPISDSHQLENALYLAQKNAVILMNEIWDNGLKLGKSVQELVESKEKREKLGERLHTVLPITRKDKIISLIDEIAASR
ncbi:MAG TPA: UDP-N-acetylglucosamine--N-acetylmuramyl-(pentapeptide) pyrophosphoryl-undecaprenol N-acetylglucosamine transferase [Candidatus Magasanikbacteria bacterium]|nr:UDP-N-acetylglucosamine--N-acetylmuramyl-(pentapeptide) pyrophosphoryl-undecaprenol N-acetylglucosamine transferase [Candidatus Magasanikbacteria bacterium]